MPETQTMPTFPRMPEPRYQYRDENGEWKDCSSDWMATEGMNAHEYRQLPMTNEEAREYGHKIIDYFADVAEMGTVCGFIETHALVITCDKDGRIQFIVGEKSKK